MKREIFSVITLVLAITICVGGCSAARSTLEQTSDGKMVYSNMGIGQSGAGASTLANAKIADARAYQIRKQADMMSEVLRGDGAKADDGANKTKGGYRIGLVNNDSTKSAYIYHPEMPGMKIILEPQGGFVFLDVRDIPDEFVFYGFNGNIIQKIQPRYDYQFQEKISHKKRLGNILVDYLITINKY